MQIDKQSLPSWLMTLITAVRTRIITTHELGFDFQVGCNLNKDALEHGLYIVRLYARPFLLEDDGDFDLMVPEYSVDCVALQQMFTTVDELCFNANGRLTSSLSGANIKIRGEYFGQALTLYLYASCPPGEDPTFIAYEDGEVEEYDAEKFARDHGDDDDFDDDDNDDFDDDDFMDEEDLADDREDRP